MDDSNYYTLSEDVGWAAAGGGTERERGWGGGVCERETADSRERDRPLMP